MRNPTTKKIAGISSIILTVLFTLLIIFYKLIFNSELSLSLSYITIISLSFLIISYVVINYFVDKFLYRKIKVLYKSISDHKSLKKDIREKYKSDNGLLKSVEDDVIEWAEDYQKEIEQFKKLEEYRKQFLANVSHELKTPIFNIQGYIETLIDGGIEDTSIRNEYLVKAAKNIDRMINIIDDLEIISQIEDGKLNLEYRIFNLKELVLEVFDSFHKLALEKEISLYIKDGLDDSISVLADRDRIRQVLINLISNSIKYGSKHGRTAVSWYDMDENILIEIADNGIGISKQHLTRVFERFYRVDKDRSRRQGGTGLGLAIVKHIIEAHNQTINIRSDLGKGTTFGFTLKKAS
ncbi:MAG: two-component sensor histidine kinase [Ignavibacteriales bacterium]|nr:two-component sensor histidine kinase [Ignavibacteriales bacterium]